MLYNIQYSHIVQMTIKWTVIWLSTNQTAVDLPDKVGGAGTKYSDRARIFFEGVMPVQPSKLLAW